MSMPLGVTFYYKPLDNEEDADNWLTNVRTNKRLH